MSFSIICRIDIESLLHISLCVILHNILFMKRGFLPATAVDGKNPSLFIRQKLYLVSAKYAFVFCDAVMLTVHVAPCPLHAPVHLENL